jgi:hypothetical protein
MVVWQQLLLGGGYAREGIKVNADSRLLRRVKYEWVLSALRHRQLESAGNVSHVCLLQE